MKVKLKLLLSMMFIGLGLSFCSAEDVYFDSSLNEIQLPTNNREYTLANSNYPGYLCIVSKHDFLGVFFDGFPNPLTDADILLNKYDTYCSNDEFLYIRNNYAPSSIYFYYYDSPSQTCPSSSIDVLYNNENSSTTIVCDGDNIIQIDGLSTITATNKFTPYFNINYSDEDNQLLTESYSKDILYLSGGQFKKTYTGDNYWILTDITNGGVNFSGFVPTFDFTGGIEDVTESGNIFNNFAENSVKMSLSNIPSYIQYVIIFAILLFILGFIRKFKR